MSTSPAPSPAGQVPAGANASAVGSVNPTKRRPNKQKAQARSMFNPSAPPISAEKFFTDFVEKKRNNVEIVFDTSVQGRLAEPYVTKARNHARQVFNASEDDKDLAASAYALTSMALCRKMLLSVPDSEEYELGRFKDIRNTELQAPKSVIAAVANVGKFEYEDKVARLKYNSQDIFRMLMTTCRVMNQHSDFDGQFSSPVSIDGVGVSWDDLDVSRLVITSESSVRWVRDKAAEFLDQAYLTTWPVTYQPPSVDGVNQPPVQMTCSYPRLEISGSPDAQLKNVIAWLGRLHPSMPGFNYVVAAGFATAWTLRMFQRVGSLMRNIVTGLPDWMVYRPYDILTTLGLYHCDLFTDDYDGMSYIGFVKAIHQHVLDNTTVFARFLDLAKQPDDKFGTAAQMLPYNQNDYVQRAHVGLSDNWYQTIKPDAQSVCVTKIKDKGLVTVGLAFGFARSVTVVDNYVGRLNGDPNSIRSSYLRADIRTV